MNHQATYEAIKKEFCHLFNFKSHGATLEIITPLATITNKFVSVFITQRGDKLFITDGGLLASDLYEAPEEIDEKEITNLIINQFKEYYHIQKTKNAHKVIYFRSVDKVELLAGAVFDVANFIVGVVNAFALEYRERTDKEERDRFKTETNDFFKAHFQDKFKSNHEVLQGIKFNGALTINNKMHLFEYVTGSTQRYFRQDLQKAIVNFQLIEDTPIIDYVGSRIAIFNDESIGYKFGTPSPLVGLLNKHSSLNLLRTNTTELLSLFNPN